MGLIDMRGLPDQWAPLDNLIDGRWEKSIWSGLPQLICIFCQWDTLEGIDVAREHAAKCPRCCPPQVANEPSPVLVADKHGRQIQEDTK